MTINEMNLTQVKQGIALIEVNLDAVKPEYRAELLDRLRALQFRRRKLEALKARIDRHGCQCSRGGSARFCDCQEVR